MARETREEGELWVQIAALISLEETQPVPKTGPPSVCVSVCVGVGLRTLAFIVC